MPPLSFALIAQHPPSAADGNSSYDRLDAMVATAAYCGSFSAAMIAGGSGSTQQQRPTSSEGAVAAVDGDAQ